jgi:hypothetical protein
VSRSRAAHLIAAALAASALLAACGGDDGNEDEDGIVEAIEQAATTDTAERCTEYQTLAFTEQTEIETGDAAIAACEEGAGDGELAGNTVDVTEIEVDGDAAAAEVAFDGGGLNGQALAVSFAKEDDRWKVDSLDEFIDFDKETFVTTLVDLAESGGDLPPETVTCLEAALNDATDEDLQTVYLSGDETLLLELFGGCFGSV